MNDMRSVIVPKSDQLNADDLLAGPMTVTISQVTIRPGTEQPVSVFFEGDNGKPYKCCKSMARVMVHCWGADANEYVGHSMTLYCDPTVKWGGMEVGGIRISHMSHIPKGVTMALTATKGQRKPFVVKPLVPVATPPETKPRATLADWINGKLPGLLAECVDDAAVTLLVAGKVYMAALSRASDEQKADMEAYVTARRADIAAPPTAADDDTFPGDLPTRATA